MFTSLPPKFPFSPRCIFTDIDDTLTFDGQLPQEAFTALHHLRDEGIKVIPVTGACGGWCDCIARTWPVEAVIGENGAFIMRMADGHLNRNFMQDEQSRQDNLHLLGELIAQIKVDVPDAHLTGDCQYRITDIAYDIGQDYSLSKSKIKTILKICETRGVQARASSIHINIWTGDHSKYSTSAHYLEQLAISEEETVFIGDSPNDESMFVNWQTTVGVANIIDFLPNLKKQPTYITRLPGGFGFAEFAESILKK